MMMMMVASWKNTSPGIWHTVINIATHTASSTVLSCPAICSVLMLLLLQWRWWWWWWWWRDEADSARRPENKPTGGGW
jgi:hypothetical protein